MIDLYYWTTPNGAASSSRCARSQMRFACALLSEKALAWGMIYSENRHPLFGIML